MKKQPILIPTGTKIQLDDFSPSYTGEYRDKLDAREDLRKHLERLEQLQELLYAEGKHGLLIVLQGMDASGKDGTIRHVMNAFNPQGCRVASFKVPTAEELSHDFLWRIHQQVPSRGEIVIFNRSHYEDVLVVRVDSLVPKEIWKARYDYINAFEQGLADTGLVILKFFLYISKDEQKERLQERLNDPTKQWKFSVEDVKKRGKWKEYHQAYEDVLNKCNTPQAPWAIVPADRKWYRNLVISQIIAEALEKLDMHYPPLAGDAKDVQIE